jgi:hypothetical protein
MQETKEEEFNERQGQTETREGQHIISKNRIKDKQASKANLGDWQAESYVKTCRI